MKSFQFAVLWEAATNANRQRGNRVGVCLVSSYPCVRLKIDFWENFNGHQGLARGYLADILTSSEQDLSSRSSGGAFLAAPNSRQRTKGEQGFAVRPSKL